MTVAMLLLAAVAALSWYATQWRQRVTVTRVIVSGTSLLSAARLEKALGSFRGRNLDAVSLADVRRKLAAQPYIRSMQTGKELNGILRVRIEERRPAALLVDNDRRMIIDTEGFVLPDQGVSGRYRSLVPVYGVRGTEPVAMSGVLRMRERERSLLFALLDAFADSEYARLMLSEIHLEPVNGTWFAVAGSPIRFIIGNDGNFKEKLKKFEIFWQKVVAKKGIDCYVSADLRFRNKVFAASPVEPDSTASPVPVSAPVIESRHPDEHL